MDIDDGQLQRANDNIEFAELGNRIHLLKASSMGNKTCTELLYSIELYYIYLFFNTWSKYQRPELQYCYYRCQTCSRVPELMIISHSNICEIFFFFQIIGHLKYRGLNVVSHTHAQHNLNICRNGIQQKCFYTHISSLYV